ncbi:hypothetical protein PF002_g29409 [Phytophthora fragariae]|uniref:Uncharacterized protein n=1 Tax=Phytophthora fragariae TaxID=53985 RepID=A0A6A3VTC6_9STRA|nr:hypothetical protein PF002_g29409 [Phytophthora fragariae]
MGVVGTYGAAKTKNINQVFLEKKRFPCRQRLALEKKFLGKLLRKVVNRYKCYGC